MSGWRFVAAAITTAVAAAGTPHPRANGPALAQSSGDTLVIFERDAGKVTRLRLDNVFGHYPLARKAPGKTEPKNQNPEREPRTQ